MGASARTAIYFSYWGTVLCPGLGTYSLTYEYEYGGSWFGLEAPVSASLFYTRECTFSYSWRGGGAKS